MTIYGQFLSDNVSTGSHPEAGFFIGIHRYSHLFTKKCRNEFQKNTFGYTKIDDLINDCLNKKYDDVWIIGGQQIYTLFMQKNIINELYITKISGKHDCDTFFTFDQNLYKIWSNEASDKHMLTKSTSIPSAYYQIWRPM